MTSKSKTVKGGDPVLICKKGGKTFPVTADSFSAVNFDGAEVSGDAYYTAKAEKAGAKVIKQKTRKKAEK